MSRIFRDVNQGWPRIDGPRIPDYYLIYLTTEISILFKLTSFVNSSFINPSYIRDARNEMGRLAIGYLTGDKVKMVRESLADILIFSILQIFDE